MHHGRSRTRSREDSVKRRELEARRVPSLRPKQVDGQSSYRMSRPTGGREVIASLPAPHERTPLGPEAAPATRTTASTPIHAPAGPTGTPSPRARPVVEPLYPALPVIEVDRRRSRRASTKPGPFGTPVSSPVPMPVRAQHTPPPHTLIDDSIEDTTGMSSTAPSRIASASIASGAIAPVASAPAAPAPPQRNTGRHEAPARRNTGRHEEPAAVAPATIASAQNAPAIASSQQPSVLSAGAERNDATDLIPLRARSGAEPARRPLAWGWYLALAAAAAFFLATIAMSAS
jgi:hypothetical protein